MARPGQSLRLLIRPLDLGPDWLAGDLFGVLDQTHGLEFGCHLPPGLVALHKVSGDGVEDVLALLCGGGLVLTPLELLEHPGQSILHVFAPEGLFLAVAGSSAVLVVIRSSH